jgi:hypothetical protein
MTLRGEAMRALRLSVIPLAVLTMAGAAASRRADAQQNAQAAVRLVVFEDFMRPT